jgi:hypothetical protein
MTHSYNLKMLKDAQNCLRGYHERLETHRRLGQLNQNDHDLLRQAEADFRWALDHVHEVQCMVNRVFG